MARAWLIDSRTIASKVRNPTTKSAQQIKEYGAYCECPNCHHSIDNSDVCHDWPGLPAGVKFDPSDAELLEHLAAKCGVGNSKPHTLIDEFIPTLIEDTGICYTHPQKLPGAKKDGSSIHFFHRTVNAYNTGQRKRRKIHHEPGSAEEYVRWHKTGKTKPVMENGIQKGCKKIMVLYKQSMKGSKPDKSNWVMHQYHLGTDDDEKNGDFVVSKIFYQHQKQTENNDIEEPDLLALQTSPRTPNVTPPDPPRPKKAIDFADEKILSCFVKEQGIVKEECDVPPGPDMQLEDGDVPPGPDMQPEDGERYPTCLGGESQAEEIPDFSVDSLLCEEIFDDSSSFLNCSQLNNASFPHGTNGLTVNNSNSCSGIGDLENLDFWDIPFSSQDSIFDWPYPF